MGKPNIIFKTFHAYSVFKLIAVRVILLSVIIYALVNYNKNPVFISIVVIILLVLFCSSGLERIIVFDDKFVYESGSIIKIFSLRKVYYYKDIKKVASEGFYNVAIDVLINGSKPGNKIYIEFINGEHKVIRTSLYKDEIEKSIKIINKLLKD